MGPPQEQSLRRERRRRLVSSFTAAAPDTASAFARSARRSWAKKATPIGKSSLSITQEPGSASAPQGTPWQQLASEDIVLLTTQPDRDRALLRVATRYMHESEESTGLVYRSAPTAEDLPNRRSVPQLYRRARMGRRLDPRTHHSVATVRRVAPGRHAGEHDSP